MQAADRLTPEQLAAGLEAREKARQDRCAAMREQFDQEAERTAALFFDEHGSPIDFPTILEGLVRAIDTRIGKIELQHHAVDEVKTSVEANTKQIAQLSEDCAPMIEFAKAVSGVTKMMNWIAAFAKPLAWVIVAICGVVIMVIGAFTALKSGITIPTQK